MLFRSGSYLKKELKEKVYSLAAVTASDSIFLNSIWSKTPLNINSFEQFLKNKNKPHLFISANQVAMQQPQLNRFFSPIDFIESRLDLLHDGYLYFNQIKQSTTIDDDETEVKKITEVKADLIKPQSKQNLEIDKTKKVQSEILNLDDVFIVNYSKKFTNSIIKKALENISKNYPTDAFNSKQFTNIDVKIQNETITNFDFICKQYDRGYNQNDRNAKQIEELRWNSKNDYKPTSIRQFRSLTYNNPVMYGSFFNSRKSKKFLYKIIVVKIYDSKPVYVISFSIPRNHYTYTKRQIPGNYSGLIFINKDDFAIVKVIENWEYKVNSEPSKYDIYGWDEKYVNKEVNSEIVETNFEKINNLYFLTNSEIEIAGKLFDNDKKEYQLKFFINSSWNNFETENVTKISYKEEIELFDKVKFNKQFWDNYIISK